MNKMTQQEKAKELYGMFYFSFGGLGIVFKSQVKLKAKRAALICCDEIIEELDPDDLFKPQNERVSYWKQVKEFINAI